MESEKLTANRKALIINMDQKIFGTFAEIGAGQEVGRYFFRVGGAAGTIAKTMSAYDMTFSDEIYGKSARYVSRERLDAMLKHEYALLIERLSNKRGKETNFFVFADTVSAQGFRGTNECHGWLGVRFQTQPLTAPNDIIMHVRMTDNTNVMQQEALGIVGVNLLYSAFYSHDNIDDFIVGLLDELSTDRIEVDMLEFIGPDFKDIDNRLVNLKLVRQGLTDSVIFSPDCKVLQPSEALRSVSIVIERGRYQPVTYVHLDMLQQAKVYMLENQSKNVEHLLLFELSLKSIGDHQQLSDVQLLTHTEMLSALGYMVMVSNHAEFYRLISYLKRYTRETIYLVAGVDVLARLFIEKYYEDLTGGILEGMGRLFQKNVKLLLYPMLRERYISILQRTEEVDYLKDSLLKLPDILRASDVQVAEKNRDLLNFLMNSTAIDDISCSKEEFLHIDSTKILAQYRAGDKSWEDFVPVNAAHLLKTRQVKL